VKVLIADDSEMMLEALQEMLSPFSQVEIVAACKNGTDALEAIRSLKPDLAIVDLKMPGLTGIEVLTGIRKENQFTIFIILTLYPTLYYRQLAIKAGVDYFFSKEDDFDNIAGIVEEMVREEYREKGIKTPDR
jgi:DNA-binding NarL/FixJ family response regulator